MSPEASELLLFIDNDEPIYRQKLTTFRALAKKKDRGIYDPALAPKAFAAFTDTAAKKYTREFAPGDRWFQLFSPAHRRVVAEQLSSAFLDWYEIDYVPPAQKPRTRSNQ